MICHTFGAKISNAPSSEPTVQIPDTTICYCIKQDDVTHNVKYVGLVRQTCHLHLAKTDLYNKIDLRRYN